MSGVASRMRQLLGEEEEAPVLRYIPQHLALAAMLAGVDLNDPDTLDQFITTLRRYLDTDRVHLRAQFSKWTNEKATRAARQALLVAQGAGSFFPKVP